jgi:serine/threonine protein kinase
VEGVIDDTLVAIRHSVTHTSTSLDPPAQSTGKRLRDEDTDTKLHMITTSSQIRRFVAPIASRPPHARVLTRLLMETYGWPLKRFSSLSELLHVMRDAIQGTFNHFPLQNDVIVANCYWYAGHKYLYYKGILHRDVSAGNILICPNGDNAHGTVGCLIDLDYAKQTTNFKHREPVIVNPDDQDEEFRLDCEAVGLMVRRFHKPGIDYTAAAVLISRVEDVALVYVKHVLAINPLLKECNRPVSDLDIIFFLTVDQCNMDP